MAQGLGCSFFKGDYIFIDFFPSSFYLLIHSYGNPVSSGGEVSDLRNRKLEFDPSPYGDPGVDWISFDINLYLAWWRPFLSVAIRLQ